MTIQANYVRSLQRKVTTTTKETHINLRHLRLELRQQIAERDATAFKEKLTYLNIPSVPTVQTNSERRDIIWQVTERRKQSLANLRQL